MTSYAFNINMTQATVEALTNTYTMFGMKSTATSAKTKNTRASAWMLNKRYGLVTTVNWSIGYGMYTASNQVLSTGQTIDTTNAYTTNVDLTDLLYVDNDSGTGKIRQGAGKASSLEVYNSTDQLFSCGALMNNQSGSTPIFSPTCIFDLNGHHSVLMQPIEKVLFFFATDAYNQGAVIESAETDALLVDFTDAQTRTVTYDINAGWSDFERGTDTLIPAFENITDKLITVSTSLAEQAKQREKKQLAGA